jgi:hypothetical protein
VRGIVLTSVAVEVWMSSWKNDRGHVESGHRSYAPVDCHDHVHHVNGVGTVLGAPVAPHLA